MNFGQALEIMSKDDWNKITRKGWNGKGMWVHKHTPPTSPFSDGKSKFKALPFLEMKTASDEFVPWFPSQTDLFAEDYEVVK